MSPGDIVIWHPVVLSGVPRRVVINRLGTVFCSVSIAPGEPNPNGNPSYIARPQELHRASFFPAEKGRTHAHL